MLNVKNTCVTQNNLSTPAIIPTHHNEMNHDDFYINITAKGINNASIEKVKIDKPTTQKARGDKPTIEKVTTTFLPQV